MGVLVFANFVRLHILSHPSLLIRIELWELTPTSVTAQCSDHGLGEPKKSSEEETHTLGDSQRTTMQEYLLK